jgi:hypothetical protein
MPNIRRRFYRWFRLWKQPGDPEGIAVTFSTGRGLIMLERRESWQVGYVSQGRVSSAPRGRHRAVA